jgi:hypothetical protein
MASFFRTLILPLVALVAFTATPSNLTGQNSRVQVVRRELAFFALRVPSETLFVVLSAGSTPVPITFFSTARSAKMPYVGGPVLDLLVKDARTPSGFGRAAQISLEDSSASVLVVLGPKTTTYPVFKINDDPVFRKPGELLIFNATNMTLAANLNGGSFSLVEGMNPGVNAGSTAKIQLTTHLKERELTVYANSLRLGKDGRGILFLMPPRYPGSVEVEARFLADIPPSPSS